MKRIITLALLYFLTINVFFSQETCFYQSFIIKIDVANNVPSIQNNIETNTISLIHNEQYITDIFSKHIIYGFEKSFPNATSENLKSYYTLMCSSKDLINELYATVPNDVFFIENNYQVETVNETFTYFFNTETVYNLKEFIATSDAGACTFDCDLNPVPSDFNVTIKVYYDNNNESLIMESTTPTSCGNSFIFKFKQKANSTENIFVIWETISDSPCFNSNDDSNCDIERIFYETILNNFELSFNLSDDAFTIQTPNGVFGENVLNFKQERLSLNDELFLNSILVTPNPVKNFLSIKINQQYINIDKISIFDFSGKEIISNSDYLNPIDISYISSGVYLLQVKTKNGLVINRKIIKK